MGPTVNRATFARQSAFLLKVRSLFTLSQLFRVKSCKGQNQLELIDYGREPTEVDYAHMIQSFHRFLVDHLSSEGNSFPHNPLIFQHPPSHATETAFQADTHPNTNASFSPAAAPVTQLLGIDAKNIIVCLNCKAVREKENMTHVVDMIYPRKVCYLFSPGLLFININIQPLPNELPQQATFSDILRVSLIRQMTHKATCQTCKQFSTFSSRRSIPSADLPPILAVNASVYNDENLRYWLDTRTGRFLAPTVEVRGEVEGVDDAESVIYELRVRTCGCSRVSTDLPVSRLSFVRSRQKQNTHTWSRS